ncbi:reverse transcriptase [Phytophthora megakarya]|uniref:Reverse transcriptase n=1 Tax=Phytophthora megakarya TaxID=4795 RepID=A0A225WYL8_9STRA|nr:reverse transcriptase [Phytophthora megakarya]
MTERAREISACITIFGLLEWPRMPFGLKNAPQIYQQLLGNDLYGFPKIGNGENAEDQADVFTSGEPEMGHGSSVLGRRSYIDDILATADSWDNLCEKVEGLLDACDRWNLSISVVKSAWGMRKTLRAMQSFLGSLNYYRRFIEDFAVYAAILYEQRESDFFELRRRTKVVDHPVQTGAVDQDEIDEDRWTQATVEFTMPKAKIVSTPILKHFDPGHPPVIVVYANKWAISAALMQEHDGVFWSVTFTSCILKTSELNHGIVEKEVLALLRILGVCHTMLVFKTIKVLTRYSTLAWLLKSSGLQGRLGSWATLLSQWTLEIVRITPQEEVDEALAAVAPKKQPRQVIMAPEPTVELSEELTVVSFDGSARVKRGGGAYSAFVWNLPEWTIITVSSAYATQMTVKEAEYHGLILYLDVLANCDRGRLVICVESNLVIRQMRGKIACKAPALQLLREEVKGKLSTWPQHEFVHVKREWNRSADRLASEALQAEAGTVVTSTEVFEDLITLKRLGEILKPKSKDNVVHVSVIADSYEVDDDGLLLYCPPSASIAYEDRDAAVKRRYVSQCVDCEAGKGRPTIQGRSPGNLQATYPFQIIAMDHIPSLPKSYKGTTELLIWVDLFTGYVLAKASGTRTAQQIAESYEESAFRRFGASEVIWHDREPGFMSDVFPAFKRIVGQRQSPTMAYRPQANGTAERMVQTLTRAVKMYAVDVNQTGTSMSSA